MARQSQLMGSGFSAAQTQALDYVTPLTLSTVSSTVVGATLLTAPHNNIRSSSGKNSFMLPSASNGSQIGDIMTATTAGGATASIIYAQGTDTINGAASFTVATNKLAIFVRFSATEWQAIVTP